MVCNYKVKFIISKYMDSVYLAEGDMNCTSEFSVFMSLSSNFSAKKQRLFTNEVLRD